MRTTNSIKNVIIALLGNIIALVLGFVNQKYFVSILGIDYTGLNGVLTNLISMLSIVELGLGTAIIYHLYEPIANNDIESIKSLLLFYKKSYRTIALIITIIGISILPFIEVIVDVSLISENVYLIYFLFLADTVFSYFIAYKRSIIYANQQNRIVDFVHIVYTLLLNFFQISLLIMTHDYIVFLLIKIVFRLFENIVISKIADKMYPFIKDKNVNSLSSNIKNEIKKMVYGQLYHQIGGSLVMGTDNIIMSSFLGLAVTGIYSNYNIIANAANTVLSQMFNALTGSVGNLLVENDKDHSYEVYSKINFINFILFSFSSVGLFFCINDFISIWLNTKELLFHNMWVLLFSLNYYMQGMRRTLQTFAGAGGICYENRYVPIMEAIVNLIASLILVKIMGIYGVIIGTILSKLVLYFYGFPKYIYSPLFGKKYSEFILEIFKQFVILILMYLVNYIVLYKLLSLINIYSIFYLILKVILIIFLNIIIIISFYHNNKSFLYFKNIFQEKILNIYQNK